MTGMTAAYGGDTSGGPEADHAHSHAHEGGHSPGQWYGGSGYHEPHYNRCKIAIFLFPDLIFPLISQTVYSVLSPTSSLTFTDAYFSSEMIPFELQYKYSPDAASSSEI